MADIVFFSFGWCFGPVGSLQLADYFFEINIAFDKEDGVIGTIIAAGEALRVGRREAPDIDRRTENDL